MSGHFITFEGGEGSGKSTQIVMLRDALAADGRRVLALREPGGEPVAEAIREVLLFATAPVTDSAELLLFLAARAQLVEHVIRPALAEGQIVLCDRYSDSTVVYQGHARGQDVETVRQLNAFATRGLTPDLTLLLDIPPEEGLARQGERNRMEQEPLDFHRRVRDGYLTEARRDPARITVIDASQSLEDVSSHILAALRVRDLLLGHEIHRTDGADLNA
jgi:dTMP kinase